MGMKYALDVGINYIGTPNELRGCITDANKMEKIYKENGYQVSKFTDENRDNLATFPTKANVLAELRRLVDLAEPGDILRFHDSGHGSNSLGDGKRGEEAICCIGLDGQIEFVTNSEIFDIIKNVRPGVVLFGSMDCCHSGRMFGLQHRSAGFLHYLPIDPHDLEPEPQTGYIVLISGCKHRQTSADATFEEDGQTVHEGALTACMEAMYAKYTLDGVDNILRSANFKIMQPLIDEMDKWLEDRGFDQRIVVSYQGIPVKPSVAPAPHDVAEAAIASSSSSHSHTPHFGAYMEHAKDAIKHKFDALFHHGEHHGEKEAGKAPDSLPDSRKAHSPG